MKYRKMQGIDVTASIFGIGAMRLPTAPETKAILEKDAIDMVRRGIDAGVTYVDTAYVYHGGESERLLKKALADGYRQKISLATKLPCWMAQKPEDLERLLDESLTKLGVETIDFYLLHSMDQERFDAMMKLDAPKFLEDMVKKGKIRFPSFSFHDEAEVFRKIIDTGVFKMAQIQMNILDVYNQATIEGMKYADSKGVNIVVMEPLRGGQMAKFVPDSVKALYDAFPVKRSPVEWAFRFLYQFPEVRVILSGVTTMAQLEDNLRIFEGAEPGEPTAQEKKLYEDVRLAYESRTKVGCTGCEYCMPCPSGVNIPDNFKPYDEAAMFDDRARYQQHYKGLVEKDCDASKCVECGACEAQCPQHIHIIEKLKEARAYAGV